MLNVSVEALRSDIDWATKQAKGGLPASANVGNPHHSRNQLFRYNMANYLLSSLNVKLPPSSADCLSVVARPCKKMARDWCDLHDGQSAAIHYRPTWLVPRQTPLDAFAVPTIGSPCPIFNDHVLYDQSRVYIKARCLPTCVAALPRAYQYEASFCFQTAISITAQNT